MVVEEIKKVIKPNDRQNECIKAIDGKYMVLAGPGTGKTFTIIQRIKNMLQNNVKPQEILCLTFSNAAANEMKKRLIKEAGEISNGIKIHTYHAFCNEIISKYSDRLKVSEDVKTIKEAQELELIKQVIDEMELVYFVPPNASKYHFAKSFIEIAKEINSLRMEKEEYLSYLDKNPAYNQRLKEVENEIYLREQRGAKVPKYMINEVEKINNLIGRAHEVWEIAKLYSEKKQEAKLIDFSDMINFVLDAFENDASLTYEIANNYSYLLVDEYQDTNKSQNELIFNLLDNMKKQNIMVVGDDDQIIFGFQGAADDNVERFKEKYPDTKVICLLENNRSTQEVLDLSYLLMQQNDKRIENNPIFKNDNISKKLIAKNEEIIAKTKRIKKWHFNNEMQELNQIIDDIENIIKNEGENFNLSEIAILCRQKNLINTIATMLKARNIPYQIDDGVNIFLIRSSILIHFYIKALLNNVLDSDKLFYLLLLSPFTINLKDYNRLLNENYLHKKTDRKDFITNMRNMEDFEDKEKINEFLKTYDYLKNYIKTNNLRNSVIEIINRTGILNFFLENEENRLENIEGIKTIIDEATSLMELNPTASLNDFAKHLDMSFENDLTIATKTSVEVQNAVQLLTYHKSKGREFSYVYMPKLTASVWEENGGGKSKYKIIKKEEKTQEKTDIENLKLLFVGLTRAKHNLTLSFADFEEEKPQNLTKYIAQITDYNFDKKEFEYSSDDYLKQYQKAISTQVYDNKKALENTIRAKINELKISPSLINSYINCPRAFYYSTILEINIAEQNWDSANFGTAVHKTLENAEKRKLESGSYPTLNNMLEDFSKIMDYSYFTNDAEREKFEKKGEKMIREYYPEFAQNEFDKLFAIEFVVNNITDENYKLTGKIDRIEKNEDGTYSLYDYKTGTRTSEKQVDIEGNKSDYYRQLCFYKYVFEKMTGEKVSSCGLIFLEDTTKKVIKYLEKNDIEHIEKTIKDTIQKIENLEFDMTKDEKNCKFCPYKRQCRLDVI